MQAVSAYTTMGGEHIAGGVAVSIIPACQSASGKGIILPTALWTDSIASVAETLPGVIILL